MYEYIVNKMNPGVRIRNITLKNTPGTVFLRYSCCGVAQWVACVTRNVDVVGSSPIKGTHCFLEQETLLLLLSTSWFQIPSRYRL